MEGVHRTAQCNGKLENSLADCEGLEGIHVEVKRVEQLNIDTAMEQSVRDLETKKEKAIIVYLKMMFFGKIRTKNIY